MNLVYFSKTENRRKFVLEVLNEIKKEIKRAKKILLKPNIVSFEPYPTTTHPEVLEACLEFLLNLKKEVLVADGPAFDAGSSEKIIENHPLKKVCDKFNIFLMNLNTQEMKKVKTESFELELSTLPFNFDFLISLPVLKSHGECGITGALKNQYGLLSPKDKARLHGMNIHKAIAELNSVIKPNFWIVDTIQTLIITNEVGHGGKVRNLGFMLAGKDPVSLDIEGLKLLKKVDPNLKDKNPEDILHLKYAIDLGIGQRKYDLKILK
jgi:uncharacterized protein (DUF362 family)